MFNITHKTKIIFRVGADVICEMEGVVIPQKGQMIRVGINDYEAFVVESSVFGYKGKQEVLYVNLTRL